MLSFTILDFIVLSLGIIWLGVNSTGESCTVLFIFIFHSYDVLEYRFCGHSMGVIPGLVSIPVVKSFCVLFVYYGFLWEFHFAASFLLLQLLLTYLLITYYFHICNRFCGHSMGVIPGLVSIPVVKSFCVLFVYYGFLWEFHFAASLFLLHYLLIF